MGIRRRGVAIAPSLAAYAACCLSAQTPTCPDIADLVLVDNTRGQARDIGPIEQHGTIDLWELDATNLTIRADLACGGGQAYVSWRFENETNGWRHPSIDIWTVPPHTMCGSFSTGR